MIAPAGDSRIAGERSEDPDEAVLSRGNPGELFGLRSRWTFVLVAVLLVFHQALLQPALVQLTSDAPVINVSGRQRMLSQRLAKSAVAMENAQSPEDRTAYRREMAETLDEWRTAHSGLKTGNSKLQLPGKNPPEISAVFSARNLITRRWPLRRSDC